MVRSSLVSSFPPRACAHVGRVVGPGRTAARFLPRALAALVVSFLTAGAVHAASVVEVDRRVVVSTFADFSGLATDDSATGFQSDVAGPFLDRWPTLGNKLMRRSVGLSPTQNSFK